MVIRGRVAIGAASLLMLNALCINITLADEKEKELKAFSKQHVSENAQPSFHIETISESCEVLVRQEIANCSLRLFYCCSTDETAKSESIATVQ